MNALADVPPQSKHILCKRLIRENVEAKCFPLFQDLPATTTGTAYDLWLQFLSNSVTIVEMLTVAKYICKCIALKTQ